MKTKEQKSNEEILNIHIIIIEKNLYLFKLIFQTICTDSFSIKTCE